MKKVLSKVVHEVASSAPVTASTGEKGWLFFKG